MPRTARIAPGGMVFHVLNRANSRDPMFEEDEDDLAFLRVMRDTLEKKPMHILAFYLMPNHWHLLLFMARAGQRSRQLHADGHDDARSPLATQSAESL